MELDDTSLDLIRMDKKHQMKSMTRILCNFILRLLGASGFVHDSFGCNVLMKQFVIQKIFRINASTPWPVHFTSTVIAPELIQKGSRFPGLGPGCYLDGRNGISFGKNIWMGPKVNIISMNHDNLDFSKYIEGVSIELGDDCWIGAQATILPEVKLGNNTIVAAGAVVTKSFPEGHQIIGGNPARVIKSLLAAKTIQ